MPASSVSSISSISSGLAGCSNMGVSGMSWKSVLDALLTGSRLSLSCVAVLTSNTASSSNEFEASEGLNETRFQLEGKGMSDAWKRRKGNTFQV